MHFCDFLCSICYFCVVLGSLITKHFEFWLYYHNKPWQTNFDPHLNQMGPPYDNNSEKYSKSCFWWLKKASWCTEFTARNPSSLHSMVSEKIKKNQNKMPILAKTAQNGIFKMYFFLIFQKPYFAKSLGVLGCIQRIRTHLLSYQKKLSDNFSDFSS